MRPILEDITGKKGSQSFLAFRTTPGRFDFLWHFHPEFELTLILQGRGRRWVGDHHGSFEAGGLVLLGPGLPHTWASVGAAKGSAAVVIQFGEDLMDRFTGLAELTAIRLLLERSKRGLRFTGDIPAVLLDDIKGLPEKSGVDKITGLLHVLQDLTHVDHAPMASGNYQPVKGKANEDRINKVCQYVQRHARDRVSLDKAASLIHLSPGAFCKFFKRMTGRTFSDHVNDVRIAQVCHQLLSTDDPVGDIAYANGFESLTYFNRVFLKKKGLRPRQYRDRGLP